MTIDPVPSVRTPLLSRGLFAPLTATAIALAVGLAGEYGFLLEQKQIEQDQRSRVVSRVGQYRAALEGELDATLFLTNGLVAYVGTHAKLEPQLAERMLQALFEQARHVRNIGLAPGNRLSYVYPLKGNEKAVGLYYPDLPDQWPAVEMAIRERRPRLAGPLQLKQGGSGLIYRVPVFSGPQGGYWGLLSMVINADELFANVGLAPETGGLRLAVRGKDGRGAAGETFLGDPALFAADAVITTVNTPGGDWQIAAEPVGGWTAGSRISWLRSGAWTVGLLLGLLTYQALAAVRRRLRAEHALAESNRELNEAQRIAMVGSWVLDLRNGRLTWSDEIFRIFEIDPGAFGASYEAFLGGIHPQDREWVDRAYRDSLATRTPYNIVHRLLMADGRIKYVRERCETLYAPDGAAILSRGTAQDITRIREAEMQLREQKDFLSTILDNEPECVHLLGAGGRLLQMNKAGLAMLEVDSVEEANAHGLSRFIAPEFQESYQAAARRVFAGETVVHEFLIQGKRGTRRWMETHAAPLRDASGQVAYQLSVTRDITRRREAEERLALSLRGADLALTDWDIAGKRLVFGEGWTKLLGFRPDDLSADPLRLGDLIRPEDVPATRAALIRHLKGEAPSLEAEVRMRHKDGHWVWILARGMVVERNAEGWAMRMSGTAMDITARKQAEAEIARLSQWNELLLNSAGEGIYGVDRNGQCTFINPAALAMLGFAREELLGRNAHRVFHYRDQEGAPYPSEGCPVFHTLQDGQRRQAEDIFIRKGGELFPVQLTVTPMREGEALVGAEVVFQDIARRKAMEAELLRLATTDPLTGVANRRRFLEQLEMELARIKRFGKPATLLMVDIDHFKNINDTYGHAVGDEVLRHFAELSRQRLRRIDLFGRLGGEEFGILLPGTDGAGAWLFADRFRAHVAETPAQTAKGPVSITISIGIAEFDPEDATPDSILARADVALYRAKEGGRNRVEAS